MLADFSDSRNGSFVADGCTYMVKPSVDLQERPCSIYIIFYVYIHNHASVITAVLVMRMYKLVCTCYIGTSCLTCFCTRDENSIRDSNV